MTVDLEPRAPGAKSYGVGTAGVSEVARNNHSSVLQWTRGLVHFAGRAA